MNEPVPTWVPESRCPDGHPRPPHAAVPARARHTIATRRAPVPWPAILVTVALITGATLTIALGVAPPIPAQLPEAAAKTAAPLEASPTPTPTVVVGKNARPKSNCNVEGALGIDDNGTGTVCRTTPDGLRWARG